MPRLEAPAALKPASHAAPHVTPACPTARKPTSQAILLCTHGQRRPDGAPPPSSCARIERPPAAARRPAPGLRPCARPPSTPPPSSCACMAQPPSIWLHLGSHVSKSTLPRVGCHRSPRQWMAFLPHFPRGENGELWVGAEFSESTIKDFKRGLFSKFEDDKEKLLVQYELQSS
ncbi:hypothetical protein U9M48_025648 [Paspalum notatum var. saurae]|uniref:Uncharacterized protein n=1 Tax=Paspalum notatum var. saurae TaxID=547442 RepID=A0AAQ3TQ45_PASNO